MRSRGQRRLRLVGAAHILLLTQVAGTLDVRHVDLPQLIHIGEDTLDLGCQLGALVCRKLESGELGDAFDALSG